MTGRVLAGVVLLGIVAAVFVFTSPDRLPEPGSEPSGEPVGTELTLGGPTTCLPCHAAVYDEWSDSMHSQAFLDPQVRAPDQSDNFRKTECLPCHAPRPIFEHGIEEGQRVLARIERRADGVDCLSCHGLGAAEGNGVAATRPGLTGACRPVQRTELLSHAACAACHDQHNTHQEWLASPAAAAGISCADCHMQPVERTGTEAGAPRTGASHRFLGGRDRQFALDGLTLDHTVSDGVLDVTLHNTAAGHNLPTDSRNRALDLVVTVFGADGRPVDGDDASSRQAWERPGTARMRFRNPYRSSGRPSTQLPAGETATLSVPLPTGARRAVIELLYKLQPFVADEESHWSQRLEVDL